MIKYRYGSCKYIYLMFIAIFCNSCSTSEEDIYQKSNIQNQHLSSYLLINSENTNSSNNISHENKNIIEYQFSQEDAVTILKVLFNQNLGLLHEILTLIEEQVIQSVINNDPCDEEQNGEFKNNYVSENIIFSTTTNLRFTKQNCILGIPRDVLFTANMNANYNTPEVNTQNVTSTYDGSITNFGLENDDIELFGDYQEEIRLLLLNKGNMKVNGNILIEGITPVKTSKINKKFISGTSKLIFSGTANEKPFLYEGDISFSSNSISLTIGETTYDRWSSEKSGSTSEAIP